MLEMILKLYSAAMAFDVRSPLPHLFGPPGCGKSSVVYQAGDLIGCTVHTVNVSRISPLDLEGVQMPQTMDSGEQVLKLLHATTWTQLKEGDILLLDEFLRGFPEVYNGLLDILTARQVGGYVLPKVFIIAASNSTVAYDKALEDRLLHLPVPDIRKSAPARKQAAQLISDALGLFPQMRDSMEMRSLIDVEVAPMYKVLDNLGKGSTAPVAEGQSIRNLIGQVQLRQVQSSQMKDLLRMNNELAMNAGKPQFVLLLDGKDVVFNAKYEPKATALKDNPKLTDMQRINLNLNLQLIEMESIRNEKGTTPDDDDILDSVFE